MPSDYRGQGSVASVGRSHQTASRVTTDTPYLERGATMTDYLRMEFDDAGRLRYVGGTTTKRNLRAQIREIDEVMRDIS